MVVVQRGRGCLSTRVFSLHVVQAGLARLAMMRVRLLQQRSTELVRRLRATGESCPGLSAGLVPDGGTGSLSPLIWEERSRQPVRVWRVSAGQAASAWVRAVSCRLAAPEATAGSQLVPWTTMQ
jgi:hypothetical protein